MSDELDLSIYGIYGIHMNSNKHCAWFSHDKFINNMNELYADSDGIYLIFGYDQYYPEGGMNDLIVRTNSVECIKYIYDMIKYMKSIKQYMYDNLKLYDLNKNSYVEETE